MIIPSIDIMNGQAVQLIGGRAHALEVEAGDPRPLAERFGRVGEVAVIDLDAAMGRGSNAALIRELLTLAPCRVGGGIRDAETALDWLDVGARKVILGTRAVPEVLSKLPADRVIAALDAVDGEVVVEGWQTRTGASIASRMEALRGLVGGFLVTFVEREGRLGGTDMARVESLRALAGDAQLTIAGGVTTAEEVATLDRMGMDAQVGMALYKGTLPLATAFAAPLRSDRSDGLWPTVVVDGMGQALGLCWSDLESLSAAIDRGQGVYHSRRRGLWVKGETSGATQRLRSVSVDCDRDALRFVVDQSGPGFCHKATRTCWGETGGLGALSRLLSARMDSAPEGSYTERLFKDPALLRAKLLEEAEELAEARGADDVAWEAADVLYFAFVAMARAGVSVEDVARVLDGRARKVRRRS